MTFAAPLFLMAALAAAIPIVLHMINRRKAKEMPFSTLRFLKLSAEKTRRRKRIHDVLLMALRAAALLLLALGLARPTMTRFGTLWGNAHTAAVIILDNSASMGMIDQDRPRLETAAAAALQILDQLGEGDQVALLPACGPPLPEAGKLDRTQESVRQLLGQCRVSYERADLALALRQARELLAKSDAPNKQIYVISDMQRVSWESGTGATGQHEMSEIRNPKSQDQRPRTQDRNPQSPIPVILVDCDRAPKPNVAVQAVDIEAAMPLAGLPMKADVTLMNTSTVAQQRLVELLVDGVKQASSPELSLPPLGRTKHEFTFTLQRAGLHRGEVRLVGEDGSKYDDRRFFTVEADQGIPVAVVKARRHEIPYLDDAYYLERALAPGRAGSGAIRVTTMTADGLTDEPLDKYKVLFCVNLPALNADASERLAAYLSGGGCVVWICGDNVQPEAYNRMNQLVAQPPSAGDVAVENPAQPRAAVPQAGGRLLPAPLVDVRIPRPKDKRDSWHIGWLDKNHPALGRLVEPASLYESVLVYRHVRMTAKEGAAGVLARLDDGEPLLVERNVGRGKTLMLGTSVHVNWSNLPLRPIFMPLVTQLTSDLAQVEQARASLIAGQPLVLPVAQPLSAGRGDGTDNAQPGAAVPRPTASVEIIPPSGETLRLNANTYPNTHEVGVYLVRMLDAVPPRQIAYSVNFDPDETDPTKIEQEALRERLGGAPLVVAENPDDLSGTFAALREGKSLWGLFLSAVLVVLVFETFLSNRFGLQSTGKTAAGAVE